MRHLALALLTLLRPAAAIQVALQEDSSLRAPRHRDLAAAELQQGQGLGLGRPESGRRRAPTPTKHAPQPKFFSVRRRRATPMWEPARGLRRPSTGSRSCAAEGALPCSASGGRVRLVMTAKEGSVDDLPPTVRDNVRRTLELNAGLRLRFLDDGQCHEFVATHFPDLEPSFASETFGPFRGDICRAAVLALEGGFYADLDLQFRFSFSDLVDNTTTFMSAWSGVDCDILNALVAVERGSEVMQSVLDAMKA
ncbi:unnamed protein product, partial [Prorocentrum cordatum]